MTDRVCQVVLDLQERVSALQHAFDDRDHDRLLHLATQIRMTATGSGFEEITASAGELESGLIEEAEISSLGEMVDTLIRLCRRAGVITPGADEAEGAD